MATQSLLTNAAAAEQLSPSLLDTIVQESAREQAKIATRYKPVMSIEELMQRELAIDYLVNNLMKEGIDYGWVPGTKPQTSRPGEYQAKPTLFKAGAERACAFFGYVPNFTFEKLIEEWTPEKYGEKLFYYSLRCQLLKDGKEVGSGIGSASSWESKYRYRNGERKCPGCGGNFIIKGKAEYGGGWFCYKAKGGCGTKYKEGDPAIEGQEVGRLPNQDIADVVNTIQKMAQKRSYVAAALTATGLSGRFTQDLEEMPPVDIGSNPPNSKAAQEYVRDGKLAEVRIPAHPAPAPATVPSQEDADPEVVEVWRRMGTKASTMAPVFAEFRSAFQQIAGLSAGEAEYRRILQKHNTEPAKPTSMSRARQCAADMWKTAKSLKDSLSVLDEPAPGEPAGDAQEPAYAD